MNRLLIRLFALFCLLLPARSVHAFAFQATGGASFPTSDSADSWQTGYSVRGCGYGHLTPSLSLGLGLDVNWYSLDNMGVVISAPSDAQFNNTGRMFMFEAGPVVRYTKQLGFVGLFGEAGASFFRMSQSGTLRASSGGASASKPFASDSNDFGPSVGAGITLGSGWSRVVIDSRVHMPLFNNDIYVTVNAGMWLGN